MRRDTIKSNGFARLLAAVAGIAFILVSIAYGITYIFDGGSIKFPIQPYYVLFMFAVGFVIFSVFFEKERDAIYPWSLLGGAIASAAVTFTVTAAIGGMRYIWEKGFTGIATDTLFYSLSISIILSMILLALARNKF